MNISLCTDNNFVKPALVCITSIFENNKGENVSVYILTDGISDEAKGSFSLLAQQYGQRIIIKEIDKSCFNGLTVNERFPVSMYYRFCCLTCFKKKKRCFILIVTSS